jgi:WD40 repeat protein
VRQNGPIQAVAFSPDGKTLLTGAGLVEKPGEMGSKPIGGEARLWQAETGKPIGPPMALQGPVSAVAFSGDGRTVLTGGIVLGNSANPAWRGEARLWRAAPDDPHVGKQLGPILEHPSPIWSVAVSPSGQTAATGAEDGHVRLWTIATGEPLVVSERLEGTVRQLVYAPDGRTLVAASAGDRAAARLWEALPERGLVALQSGEWVRSIDVTRDGRIGLASEHYGKLVTWDLATGQPAGPSIPGPPGKLTLYPVLFTPDGKRIITGTLRRDQRGELRCWDRATGKTVLGPVELETEISCLAVSPDG